MDMQELETALRHFLDDGGRLRLFPAKRGMKLLACEYLAGKLEVSRVYTEQELGDALCEWTCFRDPATLRREMYDARLLERERNGSRYWRSQSDDTIGYVNGDAI